MPVEETLLDPPITPAPIFAYRALKGWFVGSPDSSPERDNKENFASVRLRLKPADGQTTPILSPQKRKRDSDPVVSPTKSILRTPGAATPRAKSLREVNVKFKSVSPDAGKKEPAGKKTPELKDAQPTTKVVGASNGDPPMMIGQVVAGAEPLEVLPQSDPITEEHFRRTEKEMKRLLKYGHRWREVARQKDEENARLRLLLDEAQRENKRLESFLRRSGKNVEGAKIIGKVSQTQGKGVASHSAATQVVTTKGAATRSTNSVPSNAVLDAAAQDIEDLLDLTPPIESTPTNTSAVVYSTSAPTERPIAASNPLPTRFPKNVLPQRPASTSTSIPIHSPLTALQHRIEGSVPVPSTAARTNLPADRIAAVRKRLMAKEQARKAGLSVLEEVGGGQRQQFGIAGVGRGTELPGVLEGSSLAVGEIRGTKQRDGDIEESGFDWAGV